MIDVGKYVLFKRRLNDLENRKSVERSFYRSTLLV